jgi:hypothetical protein
MTSNVRTIKELAHEGGKWKGLDVQRMIKKEVSGRLGRHRSRGERASRHPKMIKNVVHVLELREG